MKKILLAIALFFSILSFSQDTSVQTRSGDSSATLKALQNAQHYLDSLKNAEMYNQTKQGLDNLLRYKQEQRAKQKKKAFIYIGLGVFFLIILIVGLLRRTKSNPAK